MVSDHAHMDADSNTQRGLKGGQLNRRMMWIILGLALLLASPLLAERTRLHLDPAANQYHALREFLFIEGYWEEEMDAVLAPLEGRLDLYHGTPDAHLVQSMDDIRGLRPLPDGVLEFLHGHHNVYYVSVADDRLLVGISHLVDVEGNIEPSDFHFEKFDLIAGMAQSLPDPEELDPGLTEFLYAHDNFLGPTLRILLVGALVLFFLAMRLRRQRGPCTDPVVAAHRQRADSRVFLVSGAVWVLLLVAAYGLMHFTARIQFLEAAATSDSITLGMTRMFALMPDQLRLLSFCLSMGLSIVTVIILGLWSGALGNTGSKSRGCRP